MTTVEPSKGDETKRTKVQPLTKDEARRRVATLRKKPDPEPSDPPEAHAPHQAYDPSALRWVPRSDVGEMLGDVFQLRFTREAFDRFVNEKSPTKRTETIARKMKLQSGLDGMSKESLKDAWEQDFETFWRKLNGLSLVGSRGKTIEDVTKAV